VPPDYVAGSRRQAATGALKDDAQTTTVSRKRQQVLAVDDRVPVVRRLEPDHHPERRRLAAGRQAGTRIFGSLTEDSTRRISPAPEYYTFCCGFRAAAGS
jgi:hypothetical protein